MPKSPDAFRTISEVADWLGIQAHVLRFWESKFTQVKPIKRAGGRRYYRPADMLLLGGIRKLLHDDGLTIKGVQKILREEGMSHVSAMSVPFEDDDMDMSAGHTPAAVAPKPTAKMIPEAEEAVVLPFEAPKEQKPEPAVKAKDAEPVVDEPSEITEAAAEPEAVESVEAALKAETEDAPAPVVDDPVPDDVSLTDMTAEVDRAAEALSPPADEPSSIEGTVSSESPTVPVEKGATDETAENNQDVEASDTSPAEAKSADTAIEEQLQSVEIKTETDESQDASQNADTPPQDDTAKQAMSPLPSFLRKPATDQPAAEVAAGIAADGPVIPDEAPAAPIAEAPVEMHQPDDEASQQDPQSDPAPPVTEPEQAAPQETSKPKARDIGMPTITPESELHAETATLSHASRLRRIDAVTARQVEPLLAQLATLRDRMASRSGNGQPKS